MAAIRDVVDLAETTQPGYTSRWRIARVIRGQYQTWQTRSRDLREQDRQRACFSLISMQRTTAVAKWLLGMSSAATVLAFAFYIQSYLSILSIKDDCVSRQFVSNANLAAVMFAFWFLGCGALALLAIAWPAVVSSWRDYLRWRKGRKEPPLQPGHEFDDWSELQVRARVVNGQRSMVALSSVMFFVMTLGLVFSAIGGSPEGIRAEWHQFELRCLPQWPDQGVS